MKNWIIMFVTLVMVLSLAACNDRKSDATIDFFEDPTDEVDETVTMPGYEENIWSEDMLTTEDTVATDPTEDTVATESTAPTEETSGKEEAPLKKPERGSINGNTYTNQFASLTFTKPQKWKYQSDADLALYMGVTDDMYELDCESFLESTGTRYDMMAMDEVTGTSISVVFENLQTTNNVGMSEISYLDALKRELLLNDAGYKIGARGEAYLSGNRYVTLPVTLEYEGSVIKQVYYVRVQGKYMIGVVATLVNTEASTVEAMFSK